MKILKQLNRFCFFLFSFIFLFQITFAEEKIENIWQTIETKEIKNKNKKKNNDINSKKIIQGVKIKLTDDSNIEIKCSNWINRVDEKKQ